GRRKARAAQPETVKRGLGRAVRLGRGLGEMPERFCGRPAEAAETIPRGGCRFTASGHSLLKHRGARMQSSLQGAAMAAPDLSVPGSARLLLSRTSRPRTLSLLLAGALASAPALLLWAPQAAGRTPDAPLKLAQAQGTTIEVVQTLIVEPAT